jgi:hypothetical protein
MVKRNSAGAITSDAQSMWRSIYAQEWQNPEAKAANLQIARAFGVFAAGIFFFKQFGASLVPLIA